ncbi:MAG TPA: hypothetical protein VFD01_03650 [Candidatus Dormibacteraeota bacterium]|jgi:hypothetical protein|nr:hypothetical protein [Candidatus Dormibacteraeota bacterium]
MKLVLSLGTDSPRPGGLTGQVVKLLLAGLLVGLMTNRSDIRRYLRIRRM